MTRLQFTAKNDKGAKWGGEFSGGVKKCVVKQFKIGATEVTIIDCGKTTIFNNSENDKAVGINSNSQREGESELKFVSPNGEHRGGIDKYTTTRKSHLFLVLPPIGLLLTLIAIYAFRVNCEWIRYSKNSDSETWNRTLKVFDDSWQTNSIDYILNESGSGFILNRFSEEIKLAEIDTNDAPLFISDAVQNEMKKYEKYSIMIEDGPVQKFYNERLVYEYNLPKDTKIPWIVTISSGPMLVTMLLADDYSLIGKTIYDNKTKMANGYYYSTGVEIHKEWRF